jgi:hypothetical protein
VIILKWWAIIAVITLILLWVSGGDSHEDGVTRFTRFILWLMGNAIAAVVIFIYFLST